MRLLRTFALGVLLAQSLSVRFDRPIAGVLVLRSAEEQGELAVPIEGGVAKREVPAGSRWIAEVRAPGWWAPPEVIRADGNELARRVWKTGVIRGTIKVPEGKRRPAQLTIDVADPPAQPSKLELPRNTRIDCPVASDGTWSCAVPAGVVDLVLRTNGFVPEYRWGVRVRDAAPLQLGAIALRPGASVAGWAAAEGKKIGGARARLVRLIAPGASGRMRERLERRVAQTMVREDGFFQLAEIGPGSYELVVELDGLAPARVSPLEVQAESETVLRHPLRLQPPIDFALRVAPAEAWRVRVVRRADWQTVFHGAVDAAGLVALRNQVPGTYAITISDEAGNQYLHEDLVIERAAEYPLRVETIDLSGVTSYGGKPAAATLHFGGESGAQRVAARSDDEGRYRVRLPRAGSWPTDVVIGDTIRTELRVEVPEPKDGVATVDIDVPATGVDGVVLAADGTPVRGASVRLGGASTASFATTDAEGRFTFRGAPAGRAALSAELRSGERRRVSDVTYVDVKAGSFFGPFELRLLPERRLQGTVLSPRGTIPGAMVQFVAESFAASATADVDGTFHIDVPEGVEALTAIVSPPAHSLRAFRVAVDGRKALLNVQDAGGLLSVRFKPDAKQAVSIFQDGMLLPLNALFHWARGHGDAFADPSGRITVPNVSAGLYRACLVPNGVVEPQQFAGIMRSANCAEATLAPGGRIELDLR
ncbi:MAG TPA: carboxypeptidase-like regulatory domain-containing protein [Thermoanaerobaculia bacterium]|jgi:hypothetical protein